MQTNDLPPIELRCIVCACFPAGVCWIANMPYCSPDQHHRTRSLAAVTTVRAKRSLPAALNQQQDRATHAVD
jgi:hypothetical protein